MTSGHGLMWSIHFLLILSFICIVDYCDGEAQNVSTTSSLKNTDVVTAIDQFQAGYLMTNFSRPPFHNYTGVNSFLPPSIVHGFKPVYETDAQFVSITTQAPPLPPPRRKPGFNLFKKKKKRPVPQSSVPLPQPTQSPQPQQPQTQSLSIEDSNENTQQNVPAHLSHPSHHFPHGGPSLPPQSTFSRLTSIFSRPGKQQSPPWRPPQPPMPIQSHFSTNQGQGPSSPTSNGQGPSQHGTHVGGSPPHGGHVNTAGSINTQVYVRPPMFPFPPKIPQHRVSLNHYLQKISNMFSRSPHVPGYRPFAHPQSPLYPNYFPLNAYSPHWQSTTNSPSMPQARRKKLRVKKPSADRRLDQQYLTGRPRATKESDSEIDKPDIMEVKLHTGIHTESRKMLNRRLFNSLEPVFLRFKRDVSAGYRMPGIFGMDGGKPFYLDKDPNTGDITFTPNQQKKSIATASNEVEINGTSDAAGKKKKPMPIIIHSYSSTKTQGQRRPINNKFVPKKPTFFYGNRTSTLAPPRLPSFYPKVPSLSHYKNSMGIKGSSTTTTTTTTTSTTTTTEPSTTTTTSTTTRPTTTTTQPTTTTEEFRLVTLKISPVSTYPPGYDPYLPFDLLHLQTKKPDIEEIIAHVKEISPDDLISSSSPTSILGDEKEPMEEIVGSVEAVPLDYAPPSYSTHEPTAPTAVDTSSNSAPVVEESETINSGIEPTPWIPLDSSSVPRDPEGVTEQEEYYDYDGPPQQIPTAQQYPPPFYNPYNPQNPPNSFNSFGQQEQPPQPPWYYPPPPGQQPFYPPWGPYSNPLQFPLPSGTQNFMPSQPPMMPGGPPPPILIPSQTQEPQPPQISITTPVTATTSTTTTTTTQPSSTTIETTTTPQPPTEEINASLLELEDETSNESPVSVEKPAGPGFNPIQLPEIHQRPGLPPPPHHFRPPPPNFRPPYGPPPPPHHFNRPGIYPPPPPHFMHTHRQNYPFRPPPPVGDLMKNKPPLLPNSMFSVPGEIYATQSPLQESLSTIPMTTRTEQPQILQYEDPAVVVQMADKLDSVEVYSPAPPPTTTTTTTTPQPTTTTSTTVATTTTTTTTTPRPTTTSTTTTTTPKPTTTGTTTTTTPKPTTTSTTTTTTPNPTTTSTTTTTTTTTPKPTTTTTQSPTITTTTTHEPIIVPTEHATTIPPQPSGPTSAEYETYYEDYPDETPVMYNPYNNAQGQYYSIQQQQSTQNVLPPQPPVNSREPLYAQRPSIVNDLTKTAYRPQDALIETNQKSQTLYEEHLFQPLPTVQVTTTEKLTQPTTTTTPSPPPTVRVEFKPSQVDNFFLSAERILNEPGSLSPILQNDREVEEEEEVVAPLPNILPQFRPNANVDPSERLPLFGEEKKTVLTSAERKNSKIPEGPVEIPLQSIEYEDEEDVNILSSNLTDNQEITGMFPPALHPPHPPYARPPTPASFLSNLFYGNKRGPPLPPHVMIGYGNETMRPPWGHHQPPPGHMTKFPPGQFPPHGQFPPNGQYGQGPPLQNQGIPLPLPPSIHFPGQGPPLPNPGLPPPPPGFFQQGQPQQPIQNYSPTAQPEMKYFTAPQPQSQPNPQQGSPHGGQSPQGRPHLIHGPPPPGMPPPQFHNQQGQSHPHGQHQNGFYLPGPPPPQGQGHFLSHPPNGKFQDDNQVKRNGQRPPYPPPGFFRGPPPMPPQGIPHPIQNNPPHIPNNSPNNPPQQTQAPPPTKGPMSQPIPIVVPQSTLKTTTADLQSRIDGVTSSEEVIYVTQEELEKLKQNGQGDEFVEYSDEVEIPAEIPDEQMVQKGRAGIQLPHSQPQQQAPDSSVPRPVVVPSPDQNQPLKPSQLKPIQPRYSTEQEQPMESRQSEDLYHSDSFQPSAPPPVHANFFPHEQDHQFLPPPPVPQPQQNFQMTPPQQQQHHQHFRPPTPSQSYSQLEPKIKPSQPLDYDDLITGPVVDVTRDSGPRDIIVKSSFSHAGGSRSAEKLKSNAWQGAVEKVPLEDSIKFMLPGGGTKATGSIQWGGFQPIN